MTDNLDLLRRGIPQGALEAEQAVMGSLLIDPDIAPRLFASVKPDDFIYTQNQWLFVAARNMYRKGQPIDAVTLRGVCANTPDIADKFLDGNGGLTLDNYLVQLMEITPTSANWQEYAKIMRQKSTFWHIKKIGYQLCHEAESIDDCRPLIAQLSDVLSAQQGVKAYSAADLVTSFLDYMGECSENPGAGVEYIRYGYPMLDNWIYTELGDVVVIGGYPSDGKTALALNLAWRMSQRWKVGFFSLETNFRKLRDRLMAHAVPFDFSKIKRARYQTPTESDWNQLSYGVAHNVDTKSRDLTVIEAGGMSVGDIQSISRAYGFKIIFVDYIQIVAPEAVRRYGTRAEEVAAISRSLHNFAQSTGTTVFELSQLTRSQTGNPKSRDPHMDSLRESGQLEQDADAVFLLFRKNPEDIDAQRTLRVAKNKEGRLGNLYLDFDADTQTFRISNKRDGKDVMRELSDAGRAVKARNRASDYPEQMLIQSGVNTDDLPF